MARQYPRFLYSNPKNTKSKGPFVIHTFFPKGIFTFSYNNLMGESILEIEPIEYFDSCNMQEEDDLMKDMKDWIFAQIKMKAIKV